MSIIKTIASYPDKTLIIIIAIVKQILVITVVNV